MMLRSLCLPSIQREYGNMANQAESSNWGFEQYLKILLELEVNERAERHIERLLKRSGLPQGKSLATLNDKLMPTKVRRQIPVKERSGPGFHLAYDLGLGTSPALVGFGWLAGMIGSRAGGRMLLFAGLPVCR